MEGRDHQASDARLTIAVSGGDDEAFAVLYARYAPRISTYLSRLLDDEHLAQDLTHEVFVSALRRLRNDRPPIAFGPWLYRIARNASIDVHRRAQIVRQVPLDQDGEEPVGVAARENGPEAAAEVRQWLEQLRDVLGGLSETHRSVLVLRELEGLSNSEIGRRLGVSRPAVEGLLFRARAKMRREYDDLASGRRCETVQASLDRAGDGHRLGARELGVAARHVRACAQCRRHAWEIGVTELLAERQGATPRRVVVPVPLVLAALIERLYARLHALARGLADPPAALATAGGRAAAAVTALAVAGGAAVPSVRHAVVAPDARAAALATAPALLTAARSAAAAPTRLPDSAAPTPGSATGGQFAVAPAPSGSLASPAATPTALPGHGGPAPAATASPAPANELAAAAPAAAAQGQPAAPATAQRPARPRRPVRDAADRTADRATRPSRRPAAPRPAAGDHLHHVAAAGDQLRHAADRAPDGAANLVRHVVAQAAPAAGRPLDQAGGVVTEAAQTATQVVDAVAGAPQTPAAPAQDAPPPQDAAGTAGEVVGAVTGPAPAVPVAPPAPPPPAPALPPAPAAPQPPAAPDPPVPTPADAASAPPLPNPHLAGSGTLADRRRAEAFR